MSTRIGGFSIAARARFLWGYFARSILHARASCMSWESLTCMHAGLIAWALSTLQVHASRQSAWKHDALCC